MALFGKRGGSIVGRATTRQANVAFSPSHYEDRDYLVDGFYRSYDATLAYEMATIQAERPIRSVTVEAIGEGRHFKAIRYRTQTGAMEFCMALPKDSFFGIDAATATRKWQKLSTRLAETNAPMIPPMESIVDPVRGVLLGIVTPFGDRATDDTVNAHWRPLSQWRDLVLTELALHSLEIDDYIQIKRFGSIPFICDFSDLTGIT